MNNFGKIKIYETLSEIVNPDHTALVVWDVQNALFSRIYNQAEFLVNLKQIIGAARKVNVPIIYSKILVMPKNFDSSWRIFIQMRRFGVSDPEKLPPWLPQDSPLSQIPTEFAPFPNDIVINKYTASLFIGTHVETLLHNAGIKTLLFTGIATEAGVESSARESSNRGFYTLVVEDCVSTIDHETQELALTLMKRNFMLLVKPSAEIIKEWSSS